MEKELKKCYHYMDLRYDSTIEEIKSRQKNYDQDFSSKERKERKILQK